LGQPSNPSHFQAITEPLARWFEGAPAAFDQHRDIDVRAAAGARRSAADNQYIKH
jgi:hypothetical protein